MLPILLAGLLALPTAGSSPGPSTEEDFLRFAASMHGVSVDPGPDGDVIVTPLWSVPRAQDVFCDPADPAARRMIEYGITVECARSDDPPLDEPTVVRDAARQVEQRLRSGPGGGAFPRDPTLAAELQAGADRAFRARLEEQHLGDRLLEAWKRHVVGRSACGERVRALAEEQRQAFLRAAGDCEGRWEEIIEVCTSRSRETLAHVAVHPPASTSPARRAAVRALVATGLTQCLARLIDRSGDAALVERVRSLTLASERHVLDDARRRAWRLWRAAGVEDWLERTRVEGRIPADVSAALERCRDGLED